MRPPGAKSAARRSRPMSPICGADCLRALCWLSSLRAMPTPMAWSCVLARVRRGVSRRRLAAAGGPFGQFGGDAGLPVDPCRSGSGRHRRRRAVAFGRNLRHSDGEALGCGQRRHMPSLLPVLNWRARVAQVKEVSEGAHIGYGRTFRVAHHMRIAVLPVGSECYQ